MAPIISIGRILEKRICRLTIAASPGISGFFSQYSEQSFESAWLRLHTDSWLGLIDTHPLILAATMLTDESPAQKISASTGYVRRHPLDPRGNP